MNLLWISVSLCLTTSVWAIGLKEEFTWTRISYDWSKFMGRSRRQTKPEARSRGVSGQKVDGFVFPDGQGESSDESSNRPPGYVDYQFENNIPMGANVWKNKLFISVPRRRLGVPSTLNYVPLNNPQKHNVPLIPYPNAQINLYPPITRSALHFVSVYRVAIDPCDRLWFVDTGIIEIPGNITQVQPTSLYVMDLKTDKIVQRYVFPTSDLRSNTNLASVTVDTTKDTCSDAYAYMPDLAGYGLIVYSLRDNRSWRISHNYFFLEPMAGEFHISGHDFQWNDGIFSVELTAMKPDGSRDLYFHSMAGTHLYQVNTRVLRNETLATRSYHADDFQIVGDRGDLTQTSSADIHKPSGVMFLGLVNQNALACWKIGNKVTDLAIIQKDDNKMIYPCDVKVYNDKIYLLTNGMPEFLYGRLNYDQTNFRVWQNDIAGAVQGTSCAAKGKPSGSGHY